MELLSFSTIYIFFSFQWKLFQYYFKITLMKYHVISLLHFLFLSTIKIIFIKKMVISSLSLFHFLCENHTFGRTSNKAEIGKVLLPIMPKAYLPCWRLKRNCDNYSRIRIQAILLFVKNKTSFVNYWILNSTWLLLTCSRIYKPKYWLIDLATEWM